MTLRPRSLHRCLALAALLAGCSRPESPQPAPDPPAAAAAPAPESVPAHPVSASPELAAPKPPKEDAAAAIEHLLGAIADSPLVFVRNGTDHTGKEASAHIRSKYERSAKDIASAEDFIAKAATKSEVSGAPYLVRHEDGREQPLAEWLAARLAEWRAKPH